MIISTFAGAERGAAIGTWTARTGISTVIGPLLGGWLIGVWRWRLIFLLNVPIAAVAIAISLRLAPRASREEGDSGSTSSERCCASPVSVGSSSASRND